MPAAAPFTRLCLAMNTPRSVGRADLHMHTTASDGTYTPAQLLDLARRSGLAAIAITDHDTIAGYQAATQIAISGVELVPGVEISAEHEGREFHLLAYFFDPEDTALMQMLNQLRQDRAERFREMIRRLRSCGVDVSDDAAPPDETSLGRRHLAMILQETGKVGSVREAFYRYLGENGPAFVPKQSIPLAEAIPVVREAGGLTSCAHPRGDLDLPELRRLADMGLRAIEAVYPSFKRSRRDELKRWAALLGLGITGGSDCHGPDERSRTVGACSLSTEEWGALRELGVGVKTR
ncbi:MAG: PHP domain-containing protein [Gemmataceae bacterium]